MVEQRFRVPEISCEHCVRAITNELTSVPGIEAVDINRHSKLATVRHADSVSDERIIATIAEAGYDVAG